MTFIFGLFKFGINIPGESAVKTSDLYFLLTGTANFFFASFVGLEEAPVPVDFAFFIASPL